MPAGTRSTNAATSANTILFFIPTSSILDTSTLARRHLRAGKERAGRSVKVGRYPRERRRQGAWWAPRSSKPVWGRELPGGFDSRPPPRGKNGERSWSPKGSTFPPQPLPSDRGGRLAQPPSADIRVGSRGRRAEAERHRARGVGVSGRVSSPTRTSLARPLFFKPWRVSSSWRELPANVSSTRTSRGSDSSARSGSGVRAGWTGEHRPGLDVPRRYKLTHEGAGGSGKSGASNGALTVLDKGGSVLY